MRGANRAAGNQLAVFARHGDLSGLAAHLMNAIIERRIAAFQRIDRHGARDHGGAQTHLPRRIARQRERRGHLRAVDQRQAFFGAQLERLESRRAADLRSRAAPRRARAPRRCRAAPCSGAPGAPDRRRRPPSPGRESPDRLHARSSASRASISAKVMPEWPRASALIFSARISRTTASGSASPTPAACESKRLRCRSSSCSRRYAGLREQAEARIDAVSRIADRR